MKARLVSVCQRVLLFLGVLSLLQGFRAASTQSVPMPEELNQKQDPSTEVQQTVMETLRGLQQRIYQNGRVDELAILKDFALTIDAQGLTGPWVETLEKILQEDSPSRFTKAMARKMLFSLSGEYELALEIDEPPIAFAANIINVAATPTESSFSSAAVPSA